MKNFFRNALTIGVGIVFGAIMLGIIAGIIVMALRDPSTASGWIN